MNKRIFKNQTYTEEEIPFYKIGTFGGVADSFITRSLFEDYRSKYPYPQVGDVLISASGSIGKTVEFTGKDEYFQDSNIVWLKHNSEIDNKFLKHYYTVINWDGIEGSTIKRLYNSNILNTNISKPNVKEQKKIGKLFDKLDDLITLHQRKSDKFTKLTRASKKNLVFKNCMVKLPKITDAWEQRKLEDLANRYDNLRVPVSAINRVAGDIPYYGANGIQDYVDGYTHNGEFILVAEDGANDLKNYPVQYVNGYFWANNHTHVLQAKPTKANNLYLKYCISNTNIENLLVGGGRAKLNANVLMEIPINKPTNTDEQTQIGNLFYKIDTLITLHQRE